MIVLHLELAEVFQLIAGGRQWFEFLLLHLVKKALPAVGFMLKVLFVMQVKLLPKCPVQLLDGEENLIAQGA